MVPAAPAMALANPVSLIVPVLHLPPWLDVSATPVHLRCHYMPMVGQPDWALCVIFAVIHKSLFMGHPRGHKGTLPVKVSLVFMGLKETQI